MAILWLAVPRLTSALYLLPGNAAIELIQSGARPGDGGIIRAIDAQTASLGVMERAGPHMDTAYLAQALADSLGPTDRDVPEILSVARHHLGRALTLAPANARGWLMLAGHRLRDGDEPGAVSAVAVSFAADPHLPRLAPFRWPMAQSLGKHLARATREQANLEFLSFFRIEPEIAVRLALRQDRIAELTALANERGEDRERLARVVRGMRPAESGA
jgi:hypothetical protein